MTSRSLWLVGVLLISPAWSQQPATDTPALTPHSFDRSSESIKKIVRDVAATQSSAVQLSEETPDERESYATYEYMTPIDVPPPLKSPAPPRPTASKSDGFLSTLVDVLVDTALDDLSSEHGDEDQKTVTQAEVTLPRQP